MSARHKIKAGCTTVRAFRFNIGVGKGKLGIVSLAGSKIPPPRELL